ncbi:hypothetical protein G7046_g6808 [Stylonectria norvegica]|nr:hypothetical protein G7046_g6808 [Stylonectria norvegica]
MAGLNVLKAGTFFLLGLVLLLQILNSLQSSSSIFTIYSIFSSNNSSSPTNPSPQHPLQPPVMAANAAKVSAESLIALIKNRRSYYPLSKNLTITPARIQEIVNESTLQTPSSFNSQTNRLVVLFGAEHEKLWDITSETLKPIVPEEGWEATAGKLALFKGAAGTILFFDDITTVESFQAKFAIYADRFPGWATQSLGIQQFILWTALEAEGLGANLQHYNPLIDEKVAATWSIPTTWKLNAQLVFGGKTGEAATKSFLPLEDRVKVFWRLDGVERHQRLAGLYGLAGF